MIACSPYLQLFSLHVALLYSILNNSVCDWCSKYNCKNAATLSPDIYAHKILFPQGPQHILVPLPFIHSHSEILQYNPRHKR